MEPFVRLTSIAVPLGEDNVDTDIILPARFLLHTEKTGLGRFAFYERRKQPGFVLDDPRFADAHILIAGTNFGCGSSREQAPWALADLGFKAIIAQSFGEIFASNCVKNGILPVRIADVASFMADAEAGKPLTVDLVDRLVLRVDGEATPFTLDDASREALLNGWDEIETIDGRHGTAIRAFETRQKTDQPWLWSDG